MTRAKNRFKLFRKLIVYKLKSRHRKGFGIHSPAIFSLVNKGFREDCDISVKRGAVAYKQALKHVTKSITRSTFGAGSLLSTNKKPTTPALINRAIGISMKHGELLYKLSTFYGREGILELGTGLGSATYYLASGSPTSRVITVEGHRDYAETAKTILEQIGITNIDIRIETFANEIKRIKKENGRLGLFFIDGDHSYTPTLQYFKQCAEIGTEEAVIIIDDIHWSDDMDRAWKAIKESSTCRVSVDLFRFGIIFTNKKLQKQHYIVRY